MSWWPSALARSTQPRKLASQAVESLLGPSDAADRREPGFIALGSSGRSDVSEQAEEILGADFGA